MVSFIEVFFTIGQSILGLFSPGTDTWNGITTEYDFIIVGGGSAGSPFQIKNFQKGFYVKLLF